MALDPTALDADVRTFLTERHLATLTTMRPDGTPHVSAVGFTWDNEDQVARVITWTDSKKARNVSASPGARAVVAQVDGGRWLALEGTATLATDDAACREGERRYADRYREPTAREDRAVIEIRVDRILGRA